MLDENKRLEGLFVRRKGEALSDYAARMLALIKVVKSHVEFEAGQGIDFDDLLEEVQEIIDGNARASRCATCGRSREQGPDFVALDGSEWMLQRDPGETEEEFEARRRLVTNRPRILRQPGIMSSCFTVEGTRVTALSIIIELIDGGASEAEVHETYPTLPQGSVPAVVDWLIGRLRAMSRMLSGAMRPWERIYKEYELDMLGQLGDGDSEIPEGLQYSLDDLDGEGNRIDLADRIVRDVEQWNAMLAPGRPAITVRPGGLPERVLNRLRAIAEQHPHARIDLASMGENTDDDGQDDTA